MERVSCVVKTIGGAMLCVLASAGTADAQPPTPAETALATARSVVATAKSAQGEDEAATVAAEHLRRAVRRVLVEAAVADPSTSSTQAASQHQVTVVADKGEVSGRARFYIPIGPITDGQITFTTPLAGGRGTFATLDGLGKNVTVNASVKVTLWSKTLTPPAGTATAARTVSGGAPSLTPTRQFFADLERLRQGAATGEVRAVATAVADSGDRRLARVSASPSLTSTPERFYAAVAQELPDLVATRWAAHLTGGVESTRHSVGYLPNDTAKSETFEKTVSVAAFSAGVSKIAEWQKKGETTKSLTPLFYAGLSGRGGDTVTTPDKKNICRPLGSAPGVSECFDTPVGSPTEASVFSLTAEFRYWAYDQSIGLNPRFTYTSEETTTKKTIKTFEVPIYFMHLAKDINVRDITFGADLTGGVSIGWRNDGSKTSPFVTLFLTKVFGLP